ncbi:pilus assembly protein Flp/PilA [Ensifer adhaerens]|uniref:Pilus assembly protein Flp/PilA n=1 Tax=Ensifer adhaerens TaxID=106592 RepID=A0ACC5T5U8_ENSAD|nr:Flp family type IVb pilin [Ensifer adhaerens]MBP1876497.1 pilus assembly protein Flp/PilA [Ensifer adhaerens]
MNTLKRLIRDKNAATAVEYGLIAGLICLSLILGLEQLRDALLSLFNLLTTTFLDSRN